MSSIKYINHRVDGVLTNATSVKLSDLTGAWGIRKTSDNSVIIPDNTSVENPSIGRYEFDISTLE